MRHYLFALLASRLPFDPWVAVVTWLLLFVANHFVARSVRGLNAGQSFIVIENREALSRGFQPRWIAAQLLFATAIFVLASFDRVMFVVFGGGLVVSLVCTLSVNLQSLLTARALLSQSCAEGSLKLSARYTLQQVAYRLGCGGVMCTLVGVFLAHLSLLGGGLLLIATGLGYRRRARALAIATAA